MPTIARIGDSCAGKCDHGARCCPHFWTGTVTKGSSDVLVEGQGVARKTDTVTTNCPHCGTGTIVEGSSVSIANGLGISWIGAAIITPAGDGKIVSSAKKTQTG